MTPCPHAAHPVLLGFLVDQHDAQPKTTEMPWGTLSEYFLTNSEESPCAIDGTGEPCAGKDCPHKSRSSIARKPMAFVPGVVEGARRDKCVRCLTLLVLDYDHLRPEEAVRVEAALARAHVERVLYTTHNHRADDLAFRVVVLLSRPVAADQWHRFLPAAIAYLGVSVDQVDEQGRLRRQPDPVCKNRSRLYYLPSHPRGAPSEAMRICGDPLDVDRVLARAAEIAPGPGGSDDDDFDFSDRQPLPDAVAWAAEESREVARVAASCFPPKRRNEFCLALAGLLRRAGADEDTARVIVREAARAGGSDDPEARAKTVSHTYALDEDQPLSGFTRLCDIVGEAAARRIGDAATDAKNEALLRDIPVTGAAFGPPTGSVPVLAAEELGSILPRPAPARPPEGGGSGGSGGVGGGGGGGPPPIPSEASGHASNANGANGHTGGVNGANGHTGGVNGANGHTGGASAASTAALLLPHPAVAPSDVVDLAEARRRISLAAAERARSLDRDDRVWAVLLRRALGGEPLARPGGVGDQETVCAGAVSGVVPEVAVRQVAWLSALALPEGTPFEAVLEIIRPALGATPGGPWIESARMAYRRAGRSRRVREVQARESELRLRRAVLTGAATPAVASQQQQPPPLPPPLPIEAAQPPPPISGSTPSPPPIPPSTPSAPPDPPGDPEAWKDALRKRGDGTLAPIPHNARVLLEWDPLLRGAIGWNEVLKRVEVRATQGPLARYAGPIPIDSVTTGVQDLFASAWDLALPHGDVARRVVAVARSRPFDPLGEYLRDIQPDGVSRVDSWLVDYAGAEATPYARLVGRRWLVALVARGLKPGTKVDNVLVLEGLMGLGKSSLFEILGGEWFCDTAIEIGNKDSQMLAGRYWICELAEMVSVRKTGQHAMKHFLSRRIDSFRPPFGHGFEDTPRRCIFVGTTNDANYLTDDTGNRKYWCVAVQFVQDALARLRRDRDLLLAEAVAIYHAAASCPVCQHLGERCLDHRWWFAYEEIGITEEEADRRMVETPAKLAVQSWWYELRPEDRPSGFTTFDVARDALDATGIQAKDGILMEIGHALMKMRTPDGQLGFDKRRDTVGLRPYRYYPTEAMRNAPQVPAATRKGGSLFALPPVAPAAGGGKK